MPVLRVSIPTRIPRKPALSIMSDVGYQSPYFPFPHLPNAFNKYSTSAVVGAGSPTISYHPSR